MVAFISGIPTELIVALVTIGGPAIGWLAKHLWDNRQANSARHWDEVKLLRIALERGRRRENASFTVCELLLIAMPDDPTPEQLRLVTRARQLFETALLHGLSGARDSGE